MEFFALDIVVSTFIRLTESTDTICSVVSIFRIHQVKIIFMSAIYIEFMNIFDSSTFPIQNSFLSIGIPTQRPATSTLVSIDFNALHHEYLQNYFHSILIANIFIIASKSMKRMHLRNMRLSAQNVFHCKLDKQISCANHMDRAAKINTF